MTAEHPQVTKLFDAAQAAQQAGRHAEALGLIEQVLTLDPDNPRALNTLANQALQTGKVANACEMFERAANRAPDQPTLWLNLAMAQRLLGQDRTALATVTKALAIDPYFYPGLLLKGQILEKLGGVRAAAETYGGLIASAPPADKQSPTMRAALDHARKVVEENNRRLGELLTTSLDAVRAKHGDMAQRRFDDAIDIRLGRKRVYVQEPTGLHIPYLPAIQFYDREQHAWTEELEAATPEILEELQSVIANDGAGFVPYIAYDPGAPLNQWAELNHSKRWSTYFLWDQGKRIDAHCTACPKTAALVERMPLADVPGRGPTAFFSMLAPRTRIPPHSGVTNSRLIVHLPLIVPEGCGFRVGNEIREWRVGESFMFDDTIEHEAWNDSDSPRFVLIVDTWNVFLTEAERDLVRAMMQGLDAYYGNYSPLAGDA